MVAIQNEQTGLLLSKAGAAEVVVNWLLEKAAENKEIDDALEKTIKTWREDSKELFDVYLSATS